MKSVHPMRFVGEVLTLEYGKPLPQSDRDSNGRVPAYGANGILCWSDRALRSKPSIIVGRKGSAGEITLTEGPFWPTDVTYFVEHDERASDLSYLFFTLKFLNLKKLAKGIKPGINRNDVYALSIPLPPLFRQQQIATVLKKSFEKIEMACANAQANIKNTRELLVWYVDSVFQRDGNGRQQATIGLEVDLQVGFAFESAKYTSEPNGIRLLRGDNIVQGELRWEDVKRWPAFDRLSYRSYELQKGDVVLAMDRTWVKAGTKFARIEGEDIPALLVQRVARMRCNAGLNSGLLFHLLGSESFKNYVLGIQTGLGVPHISGKQIQAFRFNKPTVSAQLLVTKDMDEMRTLCERLVKNYEKELQLLEDLKQSLLEWGFAGALTAQPGKTRLETAE